MDSTEPCADSVDADTKNTYMDTHANNLYGAQPFAYGAQSYLKTDTAAVGDLYIV